MNSSVTMKYFVLFVLFFERCHTECRSSEMRLMHGRLDSDHTFVIPFRIMHLPSMEKCAKSCSRIPCCLTAIYHHKKTAYTCELFDLYLEAALVITDSSTVIVESPEKGWCPDIKDSFKSRGLYRLFIH